MNNKKVLKNKKYNFFFGKGERGGGDFASRGKSLR